jgi:DnaJ-class molecular chaperone
MKNLYEILGVPKNVSDKELKNAYRKLVKLYHPDTNKDIGGDDRIKEINEAYTILSDKNSRVKYNSEYEAFTNPPRRYKTDSFNDFVKKQRNNQQQNPYNVWEDIFSSDGWEDEFINKHYNTGNYNPKYNTIIDPSNLKINLPISIDDALNGKVKTLTYKRKTICECISSKTDDCRICNDTGVISKEYTVKIKIPKGVFVSNVIKFKNYGNQGSNYQYGDLNIVISDITSSDTFKLDKKYNTLEDVNVDIEDTIKGFKYNLKTVLGEYEYSFKPMEVLSNSFKIEIPNLGIIKDSLGYRTSHIINFKLNPINDKFLEYVQSYNKE